MKLYKFIGSILEAFKNSGPKEYTTLNEQAESRRKILLGRLRVITQKKIPNNFEITDDIRQKLHTYRGLINDEYKLKKEFELAVQ